jgi:hypothetical protein
MLGHEILEGKSTTLKKVAPIEDARKVEKFAAGYSIQRRVCTNHQSLEVIS